MADYLSQLLTVLKQTSEWGYAPQGPSFAEPAALAALALIEIDAEAADKPLAWLAKLQQQNGCVGIRDGESSPGWPTSLAVVAWQAANGEKYRQQIDRGVEWLLEVEGKTQPRADHIGHDTTLHGWSWAPATSAWFEPTVWAYLALRCTGHGDHPRAVEAQRLLYDRLISSGGANYGNTVVLGNTLRPHLQASGLALIALREADDPQQKLKYTRDYVLSEAAKAMAAASLGYALLGLAANGAEPPQRDAWLNRAAQRTLERGASALSLALLTLASQGAASALLRPTALATVNS